ncbi:MAG: GYD domain-containing protein [Methylotenera sp.]
MQKYLIQANYVGEGIKGLLKEGGTNRRATVEKVVKSLGGNMEAFYYAFGETDLYLIAEFPDNASVASFALTASASGAVTIKTTVLMTPDQIDEATKKAPSYRPPGK